MGILQAIAILFGIVMFLFTLIILLIPFKKIFPPSLEKSGIKIIKS